MRRSIIDTKGNDMIPFFVLVGAIAIVVIGVAFANFFFFTTEEQPEDNGRFLDEEIVDRGDPYAVIEVTNFGTIKIALDQNKAPITVNNFVELAQKGFYDGLAFHRVILGFMIQGGDPNGDGTGGPGYTIEPETDNGLKHDRGVIAMAKRGGETRMSGSQFFIVQGQDGAPHLDGEHTVFGKVVEGMDVVDAIANTQTDANDRPLNPVIMSDMSIVYE
jgi:cyclophilin family peptidyl-prolyl cis-trans isomerase